MYSRGSSLDLPNPVIDEMIPGPRSAGSEEDAYSVVVFYFSDGEEREQPEADEATIDAATGMIIGAGAEDGTLEPVEFVDLRRARRRWRRPRVRDENGAPMIEFHGSDEVFTSRDTPYVFDYSRTRRRSRDGRGEPAQIADELGVPYLHRVEPGGLAGMAARLAGDGAAGERRLPGDPRPALLDPGAGLAARSCCGRGGLGRRASRHPARLSPRRRPRRSCRPEPALAGPSGAGDGRGRRHEPAAEPPASTWPRIGVAIASVALLAPGLRPGRCSGSRSPGRDAYDDGGYDESIDAFGRLESWNVIDPSLAFVGIGDASYRQGDLVEAELAFAARPRPRAGRLRGAVQPCGHARGPGRPRARPRAPVAGRRGPAVRPRRADRATTRSSATRSRWRPPPAGPASPSAPTMPATALPRRVNASR